VYVFSESEDGKSRALDNLGRVYARMGKFEEAIKVYVMGLLLFSPSQSTICRSTDIVMRRSKQTSVDQKIL
jgi:hypothetical protein